MAEEQVAFEGGPLDGHTRSLRQPLSTWMQTPDPRPRAVNRLAAYDLHWRLGVPVYVLRPAAPPAPPRVRRAAACAAWIVGGLVGLALVRLVEWVWPW